MEQSTPIEQMDLKDYNFWLYSAHDGEQMIGPAILDVNGKRIGQLVLERKP
jgi:hypothetical protein